MHVRYLQHQHQGTVQLLLMPLTTEEKARKQKWSNGGRMLDDDENECESVPLPIQTFLWRQTNPFLGAKIGKLHEASCVTFERVVVQNILHGLSPSLSDAIQSVSRWRFVKAAFPHIVQCCASLIAEESENAAAAAASSDMESPTTPTPMGQSLQKILYILHWLLLDSANECNETESGKSIADDPLHQIRQTAFSISSIQLFVYLLAPLTQYIREEEIASNIRLESGLKIWQALWQSRQPDVLCFCAPVKQRRNQLPQISLARKSITTSTAVTQGIYIGDDSDAPVHRRPSTAILAPGTTHIAPPPPFGGVPPPKPPRTDINVLISMQKMAEEKAREKELVVDRPMPTVLEVNGKVDHIKTTSDKPPTPPTHPDEPSSPSTTTSASTIVRSVSEYKANELAEDVRAKFLQKSSTTTFDRSPSTSDVFKGIGEIEEAMKFVEENSMNSDIFEHSDKAPLVQLQDICSGASVDLSDIANGSSACEVVCEACSTVVFQKGTVVGVCKCKRKSSSSSSRFKIVVNNRRESESKNSSVRSSTRCMSNQTDTASTSSQQTIINKAAQKPPLPPPKISLGGVTMSSRNLHAQDSTSTNSEQIEQATSDPHVASYLDVAVIRCLLIKHWSEDGIYWAVKYLLNRLTEIQIHRCNQDIMHRNRSNSVPTVPHVRISFADGMDSRQDLSEASYRNPTWADLQLSSEILAKNYNEDEKSPVEEIPPPKHRVNFGGAKVKKLSTASTTLKVHNERRRISLNTLPITPKVSRCERMKRIERNKSDPSISSSDFFSFWERAGSTVNVTENETKAPMSPLQFYPEALGSSNFIEKNGHLNFNVILKTLNSVIDRCSVIRITELIMNICDTLLTMPGADHRSFFEDSIQMILKTYLSLGCPHGCNEGIRSPQADFLRVKARNLLSQMHRIDGTSFTEILIAQVNDNTCQQLLDYIHAITAFCRSDMHTGRRRSNSSSRRRYSNTDPKVPTYRNNFNEGHKGIEGIIISALLKPTTTKLMNKWNELLLPENMSLYQDVRMFITFVQEQHGNPLRRVGMSALLPQTPTKSQDTSESKSADNSESDSTKSSPSGGLSTSTSRDNASLRRGLFKKKDRSHNTEDSDGDSSPSTPRNVLSATDESVGASPLLPSMHHYSKKKSGGKLHFGRAFNLLKGSGKADNNDDETWEEATIAEDLASEDGSDGDRRSTKISFRNAAHKTVTSMRQRHSISIDSAPAEPLHNPRPLQPPPSKIKGFYLPPKKEVNILEIREGAKRFAFLLETCRPGSFPDAPLIAALLDLRSTILGRATLLLECAHYVHRCNRGDWPEWIRSGAHDLRGMSSIGGALGNRGTPSGTRRMHLMQRAAGRCFYLWGVQIGERLQKLIDNEEVSETEAETDRRKLRIYDDLEDFTDEGIVNDNSGEKCPPALRMVACQLLYQITAFLRETFQTIPRAKHAQKSATSGWEKLMSHRRWSILSNTFTQQQQVGSVQSINDLNPILTHPSNPERRISFSTADDDSSPRGSRDTIDEPQVVSAADKKELFVIVSSSLRSYGSLNPTLSATTSHRPQLGAFSRQTSNAGGADDATPSERSGSTHSRRSPYNSIVHAVESSARRLAQGRQRLLKRGSPGGAQPSLESSHKRRQSSFRARKQSRTPGNGITGSTSEIERDESSETGIGSREGLKPNAAKVSSCGLTSSQEEYSAELHVSPERASISAAGSSCPGSTYGSTNQPPAGSSSSYQLKEHPTAHQFDEEEEEMFKNLPWLRVMVTVSNSFDMNCSHEKFCTPNCFERIHRQCNRLVESLKSVYDDTAPLDKKVDKRQLLVNSWNKKRETFKKKRTSQVPRRESAIVRQSGVDRTPLALRGLLIEKLSEIEENKEAKSSKKNSNQLFKKLLDLLGERPERPERGTMLKMIIEAVKQESVDNVDVSELLVTKSPVLGYIQTQMLSLIHAPFSALLKSCIVMRDDHYKQMVGISWELLIHSDPSVVSSAASLFIICAVRCMDDSVGLMKREMSHTNATKRSSAIRRFHALWRNRYHVWLKMEDGAQLIFKVPPPGIDFTLPSPPIGQSQQPVVDPPWMPHVKTKVEELSLKEEEHSTSQTIMTMTRTRRKQKQEMVKRAVREAEERQCELRQHFPLRATPIIQQAAYEPALFHHQVNQSADAGGDENETPHIQSRQQLPVAQPLFPSSILSVVPDIIEMLDDVEVDQNGISVGDVSKKVIWSCIVEDTALFLRHFLEKLTNRDRQEYLMSLLRKLILRFRPFPSQTAYSLLNYLFGFVMFYVRSPCEGSDQALGMALSLTWLIAPNVHGLYFKDLKQTLKKEQCDQALMITANVPSAKKVVIYGPDSSSTGVPSYFAVQEDSQFQHIISENIQFFNIPHEEIDQYFLVNSKTNLVHMPSSYVRDYYFFHRNIYPQLSLVKMDPDMAMRKMRQSAFAHKLIEAGKVLLTHNALKYSPENVIPQRIFFLHDEFTHLPSFPRKSVESCFGMYFGDLGEELKAIDAVHKFVWANLISDMFSKMENAFMFGDLHLFINVINGVMIIHCEDILILRRCMATYLNIAIHFNTLFASQGFFLIMPTILRCYSQRQTNRLFCQTVEYVCKQFYILHRKPFLLQMCGSIANMIDNNNNDLEINAMKIKAKYFFQLCNAMENMNNMNDPLDILSLVEHPKPLKALDLCYRDDPNTLCLLTDVMASCVTVCAFAPDSRRSHQMLLVMHAMLPHFIEHLEKETTKQNNAPSAVKHEINIYSTLCVEMKALVNSCEVLARGPTRTFDIVNSVSDRGKSFIADSPQFFDPPTMIEDEGKIHFASSKEAKKTTTQWDQIDNSELQKETFRRPRDTLLLLCATFIEKAGPRLKELSKLATAIEHIKIPELMDHKCHVKLSDVALSLLKVAPYDLNTMGCVGLQKYFMCILPVADWSVETNRSALNIILRRLDKTIAKIGKKISVRRRTNWTALSNWLSGLYHTLSAYPYIAHLHPLKTITQMCLRIMVGDSCSDEAGATAANHSNLSTILHSSTPPPNFCNAVLKLTSFLMQALGQFAFSLEFVCSTDGIGSAADRLEAVLCHVLIPLFLKAATAKKDAPRFKAKDIGYCLTIMHNAINPPMAKQTVTQPTTGTTLATSLIRGTTAHVDMTGRQGSVSVTDRGHSATVSTLRIVRESVCQSIFLALKVMIMAFYQQMTAHWSKVIKIVKELVGKRAGGHALHSFIDFMVTSNLPISILVMPILNAKLNQKALSEPETHWQNEFRERLARGNRIAEGDEFRSYYSILNELQQELQSLREDFSTRPIEIPRSHTPTIAELHSDSGSVQSVNVHGRSTFGRTSVSGNEPPRRLSSSSAFNKFRTPGVKTPSGSGVPEHVVQATTIPEDTEDEMSQMIGSGVAARVTKSPSLPFNRLQPPQSRTRSLGGFGMWRSVRRASRHPDEEQHKNVELHEIQGSHRRTRSWNKRHSKPAIDELMMTPLQMEPSATPTSTTLPTTAIPTPAKSAEEPSISSERHRVVSFSTPKKEKKNDDEEEFCITARHHLV
ncbi:hypothetical protein QR680_011941 [Steinernema hermaphroditum]|uniref:UNC80 domain-containing protein n=1 Tax=Steinernema hermaphroditum TaxID=289476 RepID=A0AA39LZV8_9BILA|nr:hypothetical protein QR680_011941 [Steinernema hermaphroditum]